MALQLRKFLLAAVGGLMASALAGTIAVSAEETGTDTQLLNSFIITESGNRVLTSSVPSDQIAQSGWYVAEDDSLYYYYADGSCAQDETTLEDGYTYLFASDGALRTGWQMVDGKRLYYNAESGQPAFGWVRCHEDLYYVDETAGKLTGVQTIDGVPYTFDEYGCVQTGRISYADGSLYAYNADASLVTGWVTEEAGTYYFTESGAASGVTEIDGKRYCFAEDTKLLQTGWITIGESTYWADAEGVLVTGKQQINGKLYYFNADGVMQIGVTEADDCTYYCGENGAMRVGFQVIGDKYYYFLPDTGAMYRGWITIDEKLYDFDAVTGEMQLGWLTSGDNTWYLTEDGAAAGLTVLDEITYYFDPASCVMLTDWQMVDGKLYYFSPYDGSMKIGWGDKDDSKVYLTEDGAASGLTELDGKTYYFDTTTFLMQTGWVTIDGTSRYFDPESGEMTEIGHAAVQLEVSDYKQFDSQWSSKKIGYSTIGKVGCLTSALAMKYSYETGTETTPDKMVSKLSYSGDNLLWSSCTTLGYTVDDLSGSMTQALMQKIYNCLLADTPVVLGAKKSSGGQHYITITGYTGTTGTEFSTDCFVINDPGSSTRKTLSEYLATFGNLYKLVY